MRGVDFFGHKITKLIIGDNPFTGHSYIEDEVSGEEMLDYHTSKKLYETLFEIEAAGYSAFLALADPFNIRIISEYKRDGGRLKIIFQPYMPMDQNVSVRQMASVEPIGIYHQGTTTDFLYESGNNAAIFDNIKIYRGMGIPVGLGTHRPDVIELSEREGWEVDFYLACLQNARRGRRGEASGFITGKTKSGLIFYPEDRAVMLDCLEKVKKPVIAFKIFAGGQMFLHKSREDIAQTVTRTYREVFSRLKPDDLAAIGVFQKYHDQLREDARLFDAWCGDTETRGYGRF